MTHIISLSSEARRLQQGLGLDLEGMQAAEKAFLNTLVGVRGVNVTRRDEGIFVDIRRGAKDSVKKLIIAANSEEGVRKEFLYRLVHNLLTTGTSREHPIVHEGASTSVSLAERVDMPYPLREDLSNFFIRFEDTYWARLGYIERREGNICGDGIVDREESCDDGNDNDADRCGDCKGVALEPLAAPPAAERAATVVDLSAPPPPNIPPGLRAVGEPGPPPAGGGEDEGETRWYASWWFWTLVAVAAGAATGAGICFGTDICFGGGNGNGPEPQPPQPPPPTQPSQCRPGPNGEVPPGCTGEVIGGN